MRSAAVSVWVGLVLAVFCLVPAVASAAPDIKALADKLRTSDDYRVRTQAALALGASSDAAAVLPLCQGLGDENVSVRVAAAAALGKLAKPAALPCLRSRATKESSESVKRQIDKAIASLDGPGESAGPAPPGPNTKFYVAVKVTNKTAHPDAEIEDIVRRTIQAKFSGQSAYAVAPKDESVAQGGKVVHEKKLKGYYLVATVEAPRHAGSDLTQVVRVSMMTYPDKALKGEFAPKLTWSGAPNDDKKSEYELMTMCVENAVDTFQKVVASL